MTDTLSWAERELDAAGYRGDEEGPNKWLRDGTLELLTVFGSQGHSGSSAPYAISIFERLASHKPLSPLTGAEDEWNEVGTGVWQNRRASNVFKDETGPYWLDGIVFWEWYEDADTHEKYKTYFTSRESRVLIAFPFTMPDKPEYRERIGVNE